MDSITRNKQTRMISEKKFDILNLHSDLLILMEEVYQELLGAGIPIILPYNLIRITEQGNFASCLTETNGDPDKALLIIMNKERRVRFSIISSIKDPEEFIRKKVPVSRSEFMEKQLPEIIKGLKKSMGQ